MKWTLKHIEKLKEQGKIKGYVAKEAKKARRAKYNNKKVEYDGKVFDSKKEYRRYRELLLLLKRFEIAQLECQVKYVLIPKSENNRETSYWADFRYIDTKTGQTIVEDVKGVKTDVYKLKKKLMKQVYKIKIKET